MSDRTMAGSSFPDRAQPIAGAASSGSAARPADDRIQAADGYAGDISPHIAWQWAKEGVAVIVDVRTDAEREWVGFVPGAVALAWKQWPEMQVNTAFEAALHQFDSSMRLLMLCRSGVRSIAAARAAAAHGYRAFNILEGFEGDRDDDRHRSNLGGWKRRGLPWEQN